VGFLSVLRPGIRPAELAAAVAGATPSTVAAPLPLPLASPWAPTNNLASVVWADIFGATVAPVTRAEAMAVPAMARARHIIAGTIARIPLRAYRGTSTDPLPDAAAPSWLTSTASVLSPWHRMLWTVDDLVFYGWSVWSRVNGADGRPYQMDRIAPDRWSVDSAGRVWVDNVLARTDQVVVIPGPHEGLLAFAQSSIRHAADLQRAAGRAAKHPAAYLALKQTGGDPLTDTQIDALTARWAQAREGENGGVAFLNQSIEAQEIGTFDRHLVLDGRNAAAVDIARHASLPADLLDASGEQSLTYANSRDNDRRGVDYGSGLYMGAISGALSQDAVVPHGTRVAFDLEQWLEGTVPGQAPDTQTAPTPPAPAAPAATGEDPA
jgi:hypothetical protein